MVMDDEEAPMYPWAGDFEIGNPESPVAVVTLSGKLKLDMARVAISGPMKTENLGVEKVVANVISNPNVRFLIVAGEEVRGHRSGDTVFSVVGMRRDDQYICYLCCHDQFLVSSLSRLIVLYQLSCYNSWPESL